MPRPSDPNAKIKLLTAAEIEFVEHGLDRAKVEDIATRAGLSKGAFYLHFSSKEDAFKQLVETTLARLARFIDAIPIEEADIQVNDAASFTDFWLEKDVEIFEFIWQNRGLMRLLLEGGSSLRYRYLIDEFAERSRHAVAQSIGVGTARGLYRDDLDVDLASAFIAGAYDRYARQLVQLPKKPDLSQVLRKLQTMVVRGVGSDALLAFTHTSEHAVVDDSAVNHLARPSGTTRA
jgi:AcrR family transcriptional regulator